MTGSDYHKSVLLSEVIDLLQIKKGKKYIDATLGGGGYSEKILDLGGIVLGVDLDLDAVEYAKKRIQNTNFTPVQGNFKNLEEIANLHGFTKVSGVVYDLGVSSHQIGEYGRGFTFQKDEPLDMRMDKQSQVTAADLVNLLSQGELYEIFNKFGQDRRSGPISNAIVRARRVKAIKTTGDLLKIIEGVYRLRGEISPQLRASISKRIFQALRIAVNNELENLRESLPKALNLLEDGGRIVVISFHSLEDRIVKETFLDFQNRGLGKIVTKKPFLPKVEEIEVNRRARSAKGRVFEKII